MKAYILAIDQGTTGTRAFIFDSSARIIASSYQEIKQYYPYPGWVEHDANEILQSVLTTIHNALKKSGISARQIVSLGITNQRETTVVWDRRTGKPISRAIVWQCRRTAHLCEKLKKHKDVIHRITGLVTDAYFSGTKIQWILDHVKGARAKANQGDLAFGTIDSWLIYNLTNRAAHVTDMTNASRTMIFDINTRTWSKPLLKLLNIPSSVLPAVLASGADFGVTAKGSGLPSGITIHAVMGDQQAALYGQGCVLPGMLKNTYGTGGFLLLNTGAKPIFSQKGLLTTIAADEQGQPVYALEGAIFIAGAVIQWLRDELKLISHASETENFIKGLQNTNGVYLVPAFVGLGAPYWSSNARGSIVGLTRGCNARHIVRAALEAIAYQTKDIVDVMKQESKLHVRALTVDGGACRNNFLMQFQADILNTTLHRPKIIDTTVLGVAMLAGLRSGVMKANHMQRVRKVERIFLPTMNKADVMKKYAGWKDAIRRTIMVEIPCKRNDELDFQKK